MTSETVKIVLVIAMFGVLEALLHLPEMRVLGHRKLRAMHLLPTRRAGHALR
jgi:hypothetical protein